MKGKAFVAGNWKMNKGIEESIAFLDRFSGELEKEVSISCLIPDTINVVIFPPAINLYSINLSGRYRRGVCFGVQNVHWKASGPFTGENSALMALEAGAVYSLIGHSERRQLFGETDEMTSEKFHHCVKCGLLPVLCVGETDIERNSGMAEAVIKRQIEAVFGTPELYRADRPIIIAYEPVWAIGTGKNATSSDAQKACASIREEIERTTDTRTAKEALVLYGGSVKSTNAKDYLSQSDIDGLLVGGASLDPEEFLSIIREAAKLIG